MESHKSSILFQGLLWVYLWKRMPCVSKCSPEGAGSRWLEECDFQPAALLSHKQDNNQRKLIKGSQRLEFGVSAGMFWRPWSTVSPRLGHKEAQAEERSSLRRGGLGVHSRPVLSVSLSGKMAGPELGRPLPCQQPLALGRPLPRVSFQFQIGGITPTQAGSFQTSVVWVFLPQHFFPSLQFVPTQDVWEDNPKGQPSTLEIGVPASPPSWPHPEPRLPTVGIWTPLPVSSLITHFILW